MKTGESVKIKDTEIIQLATSLTIAKISSCGDKNMTEGEIFAEFITMLLEVTGRWREVEEVLRPKTKVKE